ncbi:tRNA pseudouridine(55) synthase TruB [Candidatus Gracilibacteria bacterium]|nr:tRNA pseudouridine(55) synthase TruB [Candidatus Gracilibacteria bacterium]
MLSGFLLVDKEQDWTSFDVCAKLRKKLGVKKIGHTGTLDPFATGLLIVAVGSCTKLIPFFEKDRKTYKAEILLGKTSETLDGESEMIESFNGIFPDKKKIEEVLKTRFSGRIEQIPPKYSALKIGGKKMCDLARKGIDFEIKPRETEIFSIQLLKYEFPLLTVNIEVSAGFYVRSFARDLGKILCGGGLCKNLRRETIEKLSVSQAQKIEAISKEILIDPQKLLSLPKIEIDKKRKDDFLQGRAFAFQIDENIESGGKFLVLSEGKTLGVGEMEFGNLQPRKVL